MGRRFALPVARKPTPGGTRTARRAPASRSPLPDSPSAGTNLALAHARPNRGSGEASNAPIARQCADCSNEEDVRRKGLNVSAPDDPQEREADRRADEFVRAQAAGTATVRDAGTALNRRQAQPSVSPASSTWPGALAPLATRGGLPIASATRAPLERFFRADLSSVRVHDNAAAAHAARSMNAAAFARGSDLYFGAGRFDMRTTDGQRLLAHEMAHVVQEGAPAVRRADPEQEDAARDEDLHKRFTLIPGWDALATAPQQGGLEMWSERFPKSYELMQERAVAEYGQAVYDQLFENDAEILVLVQTAQRVRSKIEDLYRLYTEDEEAAAAVLDFYVGVNYLWGAEDIRGWYDLSYPFFAEMFVQDAEFDLGLFQTLLTSDVDDLVESVRQQAEQAQADADADAEQRAQWAADAEAMLGTVVAKREDIIFDDPISLETLLDPPEGSGDAGEMVAVARFAGRMAAVVKVGERYHAFGLSEDFSRSDVFLSKDWDSRTEIVRYGAGGHAVHTLVTGNGFVITAGSGTRFRGGDQARDPLKHLEADSKLLESGRYAELGISPVQLFKSMVRNLALANLKQAETAMGDIRESMTTDHHIEGIGVMRGPDPAKGMALQADAARLRQLTLDAERLAHEVGNSPLTEDQTDRRDEILGEMGAILQRNPAAGFFVKNEREPDEEDPVEDDEVTDELEGLMPGDAAQRARDEALKRTENIATVRRALFDKPDVVLGLEPLHAAVLQQFGEGERLLIRASMLLTSMEEAATSIGLGAAEVALLIAGFFTGGAGWGALTIHAAGTGIGAYQLNKQLQEARLLEAMSELDVPGGVQFATEEQASSARNWARFGLAMNFLGLVGMARGVSRLMNAAQREGTLIGRVAKRAGVAEDVMEAALRRNVLGVPKPDPGALRQIVLASLPTPLRRRFANLAIDVLDEERWAAQFGKNSTQHAATRFATNSAGEVYPSVVMFRARGNVLTLQEEALHIVQATDPTIAAKIARNAELGVDAWARMSRSEKLAELRNVLEIEHDVQSRLMQQAKRAGDTEGVEDALREMSELTERMGRIDQAIADPAVALADDIDLARAPLYIFANPRLPRTGGTWSGAPGNSIWKSTHPDVIAVTGNGQVRFRNGYPVLSPWAEARVPLGMSGHASDFAEADRIFAEGIAKGTRKPPIGYTVDDFVRNGEPIAAGTERYRRAAGLTWHHHQGGRTMLLVPTRLHANVPHTGGASAARAAGP